MTDLTPEEATILMPEYEKYITGFRHGEPLSFDQWWRAMADQVKEERKYL